MIPGTDLYGVVQGVPSSRDFETSFKNQVPKKTAATRMAKSFAMITIVDTLHLFYYSFQNVCGYIEKTVFMQ